MCKVIGGAPEAAVDENHYRMGSLTIGQPKLPELIRILTIGNTLPRFSGRDLENVI
jgi:hypothetical protein